MREGVGTSPVPVLSFLVVILTSCQSILLGTRRYEICLRKNEGFARECKAEVGQRSMGK